MYKIILVDDDEFTLDNISKAVNWEKSGFELVGKFDSAERAIEYIKENTVHAIIADIKMRWMSGLEFAEYIQKNYPDICFAILSGYDNFEYVRTALRNKVVDYILKPVMLKDIKRVLEECKKSLDDRMRINISDENVELQEFITKYMKHRAENISLLRKAFNKQGFQSSIDEAPVVSAEIVFKEDINQYIKRFCHFGRDGLNNLINNLFMDETGIIAIPTNYTFDSIGYTIFCDCNGRSECTEKIEAMRENIRKNAAEMLKLDIDLVRKKISDNIYAVFDDERQEFILINVNDIYALMSSGETEQAIEAYKVFEEKINSNPDDIAKFYSALTSKIKVCSNYFLYDKSTTEAVCMEPEQLKSNGQELRNIIRAVSEENQKLNTYDFVGIVQKYVEENYAKNITVADVADKVMLSESWFSRQFKKRTGKSFVDYLNEVRITKAVTLLKCTNHLVNDIYEEVGYNSRNYFYVQFKKYMGCSPQQFRENLQKR